jgi:hypothetical protein
MRRHPLLVVLAVFLTGSLGTAPAQARSTRHLTVTPKSVMAGNALTLRLHEVHLRGCVFSMRADHRGALVRYRARVKSSKMIIPVPSTSAAGNRVLTVTCRRHVFAARFSVVTPPVPVDPGKGGAPPGIAPDEQGFVAGLSGSQEGALEGGQLGGGDYPNSRIADIALGQLGRNLYTPGPLDHGQCKQAANDWVAAASGGTQRMGGDYYANYARNGGQQISRDAAVKGDIVQLDNPNDISNYYRGMHTAVVVSHNAGSDTFDVVDSNYQLDDTVRRHAYDPFAAGRKYGLRVTIWRMGTADSPAGTPAPGSDPAPTPTPTPATTYAETVGGNANTWTNYGNAGGTQGPTIPGGATVQIACKVPGFRVADGNTWWYRVASSPWNGAYYVSADAFYNNGQTSGSLHGTPFADGAVTDC